MSKHYTQEKKLIREQLKEAATDADLIIAHLQGYGDPLTERLEAKLRRLETIADLVRAHGSRLKIIPMIVKIYGYDPKQAYREFEETISIFGATTAHSRPLWADIVLGFMISTRKLALKYHDFKTAAQVEKNMASIIEKLMGDADSGPSFADIQPPQINIAFLPEQLNVMSLTEDELQKQLRRFKAPVKRVIEDIEAEQGPEVDE